jgi:hypothetical protein
MLEEKEIDKIGQEGRSVCHPSGSCFRSPSYGFGGKTLGTFFVLYDSYHRPGDKRHRGIRDTH